MKGFLALFMAFAVICGSAYGFRNTENELNRILNKIATDYDVNAVPRIANSTKDDNHATVKVNTYVRTMSVGANNNEFNVVLTFRQQWQDRRLAYEASSRAKYLNLPVGTSIWKPDLFFSNELQSHFHNMLTPNSLIRVYPDGQVLYSIRVSLKLSCPMNLKQFPGDTQVCSVQIASYAHTTEDLVLQWKKDSPVQITKNLHMPIFNLQSFSTNSDCTSTTTTGTYSCLKLDFVLKRDPNYVLIRMYSPIIMLVLISYLSFYLHSIHHSTPKILLTAVSYLLGMVYTCFQYKDLVGEISYSTALWSWLNWSLLFLLFALVESVAVCWLTGGKQSAEEFELTNKNKLQVALKRFSPSAHPLDMMFRIIYPIGYLLYNCIYWISLGSNEE